MMTQSGHILIGRGCGREDYVRMGQTRARIAPDQQVDSSKQGAVEAARESLVIG